MTGKTIVIAVLLSLPCSPSGFFNAGMRYYTCDECMTKGRNMRTRTQRSDIVTMTKNAVGRDIVIGDIHGAEAFLAAMESLGEHDRVICVGDVADRGPISSQVFEIVIQDHRIHIVRGNHEEELLKYIRVCVKKLRRKKLSENEENIERRFMNNGGEWAVGASPQQLKEIAFFLEQQPFIRVVEDAYIVVHADLPFPKAELFSRTRGAAIPKLTAEERFHATWARHAQCLEQPLYRSIQDREAREESQQPVYYGHEIVIRENTGQAVCRGHRRNLDFGAYYSGVLVGITITPDNKHTPVLYGDFRSNITADDLGRFFEQLLRIKNDIALDAIIQFTTITQLNAYHEYQKAINRNSEPLDFVGCELAITFTSALDCNSFAARFVNNPTIPRRNVAQESVVSRPADSSPLAAAAGATAAPVSGASELLDEAVVNEPGEERLTGKIDLSRCNFKLTFNNLEEFNSFSESLNAVAAHCTLADNAGKIDLTRCTFPVNFPFNELEDAIKNQYRFPEIFQNSEAAPVEAAPVETVRNVIPPDRIEITSDLVVTQIQDNHLKGDDLEYFMHQAMVKEVRRNAPDHAPTQESHTLYGINDGQESETTTSQWHFTRTVQNNCCVTNFSSPLILHESDFNRSSNLHDFLEIIGRIPGPSAGETIDCIQIPVNMLAESPTYFAQLILYKQNDQIHVTLLAPPGVKVDENYLQSIMSHKHIKKIMKVVQPLFGVQDQNISEREFYSRYHLGKPDSSVSLQSKTEKCALYIAAGMQTVTDRVLEQGSEFLHDSNKVTRCISQQYKVVDQMSVEKCVKYLMCGTAPCTRKTKIEIEKILNPSNAEAGVVFNTVKCALNNYIAFVENRTTTSWSGFWRRYILDDGYLFAKDALERLQKKVERHADHAMQDDLARSIAMEMIMSSCKNSVIDFEKPNKRVEFLQEAFARQEQQQAAPRT